MTDIVISIQGTKTKHKPVNHKGKQPPSLVPEIQQDKRSHHRQSLTPLFEC